MGARGQYHEWLTQEGLTKIEGWARNGLIEEQIASNVGVSARTLTEWKRRFPAISSALKRGKEVIDLEVENQLLRKAMGFEYEETKTFIEEVDGKQKKRIEKHKRYALPDTTAQIFWLKNRKPLEWRDRREMDITTKKDESIKEMDDFLDSIQVDE